MGGDYDIKIFSSFQCVISCPVGEVEQEVGEQVHAGVAAVLKENWGSSIVKDVCATIEKESDFLIPIRKAVRNPLILVLDKVIEFWLFPYFSFFLSQKLLTVMPREGILPDLIISPPQSHWLFCEMQIKE